MFNHAMISVADVKRSQAFYALLGARVVNDVGHYSRLAFSNGNTLSLHRGEVKPGSTALYFHTDPHLAHAQLTAAGFACTLPPTHQVWNWVETHFQDPDSYSVVVFEDTPENGRLR